MSEPTNHPPTDGERRGLRLDLAVSLHLSETTEIDIRPQADGQWVIRLGSLRYDSPSAGQLSVFCSTADMWRLAAAITSTTGQGTS